MTDLKAIDTQAAAAARNAGVTGAVGKTAQTCPDMTLEIGVFFDGTLNNRFNTLSRARNDDSYRNALSNPALLFDIYKNGNRYDERNACGGVGRRFRSIYVEGPGSLRGQEDDSQGYALGMGRRSGVEARVLQGFRALLREVGLQGGAPNIHKVVLDVFGFSRGAAGARYFVNAIRARRIRYDPYGPGDYSERLPRDLDVEIRFLGIFDTVAAIGDPADDDNDPVNVHLKTAQVAGRIYHLTAGDEFRRNFRLNRNVPGGGDTHELPGAHSDVGGGYENPLVLPGDPTTLGGAYSTSGDTAPLGDATRRIFPTLADAQAAQARTRAADLRPGANARAEAPFIREGFLRRNEPTGGVVRHMSPIRAIRVPTRRARSYVTRYAYDERLALHRPWVKLGLSRVALNMMYEAAQAVTGRAFLGLPNRSAYRIPSDLPHVSAIRAGTLTRAQRSDVLREFGHVSMKDGGLTSAEWQGHRPETGRRRTEYPNRPGQAI